MHGPPNRPPSTPPCLSPVCSYLAGDWESVFLAHFLWNEGFRTKVCSDLSPILALRLFTNCSLLTLELKSEEHGSEEGFQLEIPPNATVQVDADILRRPIRICRVQPNMADRAWSEELACVHDLFNSGEQDRTTVVLPGTEKVLLLLRAQDKAIQASVLDDLGNY